MASSVRQADGSFDFSGGIDSGRVTTIQGPSNPNGLPRQMLAWLTNGTVRGGGITPRSGWQPVVNLLNALGLYQSGYLYEPQFANPYLILSIGGHILKVLVEAPFTVTDLSVQFGLFNPPGVTQGWMTQGLQFLVIQAGDITQPNPTLPLFWDGAILRRSNGITGTTGPANPTIYTLTTTANFTIPATGASALMTLTAPYPGALNDIITLSRQDNGVVLGTFQVTNIAGNTITLKTQATAYAGQTVFPAVLLATLPLPPTGNINELPAAGPMVYYQGRIWYANGQTYTAGDIVGGPAGTLAYKFTDAILKVTENPLAVGGDGFKVPSNAGNITCLTYTANLDTTTGQGPLYACTRKQIYALAVPVSRTDWIAAGNNNQPLQTVVQIKFGPVNDRSTVHVNGDLFYQSLEPSIRSLFVSIRYFQQWANRQISHNENRILQFNNRALMPFATGIQFDNRLLMGVQLVQTPVGVASQAIIPLDFDVISQFGQEGADVPPAWEGMWEGLDHLQLFEGDFGGLQRAFSVVHSRATGGIEVWELTTSSKTDNGDNRVTMRAEWPAFEWGKIFDQKKLDGGELWIDRVSGTVEITGEYRVDADACWQPWFFTSFCAARTTCEDVDNPVCYPLAGYCEGYKCPITFPTPPAPKCASFNKRPVDRGYQFQPRVTIKGWCRVRGLLVFSLPLERAPFEGVSC